ncbi:hypothetical protein HDV04_003079 [Boothiomyces sp. JEL0838]|nr:hypothetical protein HDV04_003079 [Boothiomyces sp. JEL0838]
MIQSRQLLKRLFTTKSYGISDFIESYPISIEEGIRKTCFELQSAEQSVFDKAILIPLRNSLANYATTNWINRRFGGSEDYLPETFMYGAQAGIKRFFKLLEDDINNNEGQQSLTDIVTMQLHDSFEYHHKSIREQGLKLKFQLHGLGGFRKGENWLTFGPEEKVKSTVLNAPIHTYIGPMVMWRFNPKRKQWLFREIAFEYYVDKNDVSITDDGEAEPPSLDLRTRLTKAGAMVGIDVICDVHATISITDESETNKWSAVIDRPMAFRFESSHFTGMFEGRWKIADVDNVFQNTGFEQ